MSDVEAKEHFSKSLHGENTYYHYDSVKVFTQIEIDEANQKEADENAKGLEIALADGFIELPISFRNVRGELVQKQAWVHPTFEPSISPGFFEKHKMLYNIYVPSYKRSHKNLTATMLTGFGVANWYFAIDPSQYADYKKEWGSERIILRDISFRDPTMVDLGTSIRRPNSFSGTAGIYNNLLSISRSLGEAKYFTLDDDFHGLAMKAHKGDLDMQPGEVYDKDNYYRCSKIKEEYGFSFQKFMHGMENTASAIRNHSFLGVEKFGVVFSLAWKYKFGTRVYSFYLSDNRTQVAHKFAQNNDVITSMEGSKRQMPPGLLEGISYNSAETQGSGGLSEQYKLLGTLEKGKNLVKAEPDFTRITERYSRIHHTGNFNIYNQIRLVGNPLDGSKSLYYKAED